MIRFENVKHIFMKQMRDYRIKLILMIPVFLLAIVVFVFPFFSIDSISNLKGYDELSNIYSNQYAMLSAENLLVIIHLDIKLLNYLIMITFFSPLFLTTEMIVTEKENRTIENLFSLPLQDSELLIGKLGVSILMVIFLIVTIYFISLATLNYHDLDFAVDHIISLKWLIVIFIFIPSLTFSMNLVSIFISSKVNKMQTAQYLNTLILIPAFILYGFMYKGEKSLLLNVNNVLIWTAVIIVLNIILYKIAVKLFHREKILLRY